MSSVGLPANFSLSVPRLGCAHFIPCFTHTTLPATLPAYSVLPLHVLPVIVPACSGKPDEWMDEIPTVVVDPLPPDLAAVAAVGARGRAKAYRCLCPASSHRCPVMLPALRAHPLHARRRRTRV